MKREKIYRCECGKRYCFFKWMHKHNKNKHEGKARFTDLRMFEVIGQKPYRKEKIVATSGYFDPLHVGHLESLELAKKLGDKLIVIINNRKQTINKKGYEFMPLKERAKIIQALRCVDEIFISIDKDKSVCKSLERIKPDIFAKGGDRKTEEIPEAAICKKIGCRIIDGLGKKIQSSSKLVERSWECEKKQSN